MSPSVPEPIDLNALVADVAETLRTLVRNRFFLEVQLDPAAPPVRILPNKLRWILISLVTRAQEALPDHAKLTIATSSAEQTALRAGRDLPEWGRYTRIEISTDLGTIEVSDSNRELLAESHIILSAGLPRNRIALLV